MSSATESPTTSPSPASPLPTPASTPSAAEPRASDEAAVPEPSRRWRYSWWWLVVLAVLIWFFWSTGDVLPPFLAGLVIAYLLDPLVDKMEKRLNVPRWAATSIVLVLFFALIAGIIVLIAPLVVSQASALVAALPELLAAVRLLLERWYVELNAVIDVHEIGSDILERAAAMLTALLSSVLEQSLALFNIAALLIVVPVVAFYSLRDFDHMTRRIRNMVPPRYSGRVARLLGEMDEALGGFIRGQSLVCLSLAVFYAAGWWLTGLEFALVLGLIAGLLAFIPYLGAFISVGLALLVALAQFGFEPLRLIGVFAVFQVGQIIEGSILTPNLIGNRIGLHPLWVLFAVFAGGELAGLWGILLAVPVAAVVAVLVREVLRAYLSSPLYRYTPPAA